MIKYSVLPLALGCTLALVGCSNEGTADTEVDKLADVIAPALEEVESVEPGAPQIDSADYIKPGAAVSFSHDYDGETEPGIRDSFVLHVKPAYMVGVLNLSLSTSAGLDLLVDSEQSFEISGKAISVPIEIFAENAGSYRLNLNAAVDIGSMMPSMRAHTISIDIGPQLEASQKSRQRSIETPGGEAVISNRAEETIY